MLHFIAATIDVWMQDRSKTDPDGRRLMQGFQIAGNASAAHRRRDHFFVKGTDVMSEVEARAKSLFHGEWEHLTLHEREVIEAVLSRLGTPQNSYMVFHENRTLGQRAADAIAGFGGSWTFILLFAGSLIFWAVLNTEILGPRHNAFDPYPYVFLNLILSMLAAVQAPIIMMSQNRQAARDRIEAEIDHEVNVRAELIIRQQDQRLKTIEALLSALAVRDAKPPESPPRSGH